MVMRPVVMWSDTCGSVENGRGVTLGLWSCGMWLKGV